jgi:hypothetical protein
VPGIILTTKTPVTLIRETASHIGWRTDRDTLTSLNRETGKLEQSVKEERVPIIANTEQVSTVYKTERIRYDITKRKFGPIKASTGIQ